MHRAKRVSIFLSKIFGAEFLMRFTSNTLPAPPFYHKMWRGKKCGFYEAVYGNSLFSATVISVKPCIIVIGKLNMTFVWCSFISILSEPVYSTGV